ncbi:acyltransferase [Bradyrhizobium sp. GM2.2]|uniref:acyltransferase family protein n=1 Tax=Bradyrhizobium sp. GM2.2 TaxID=3156358 RepID=UPI003391D416
MNYAKPESSFDLNELEYPPEVSFPGERGLRRSVVLISAMKNLLIAQVPVLRAAKGAFRLNRLKFLDGLRGWAAVFVLLYHVFCESIPFDAEFGERLQSLLPFSGAIAIFIFFLVSGFSLSYNYLLTADAKAWVRIAGGRYARLAVPIFFACATVHMAMLLGLFDPPAQRLPKFQQMLDFSPTADHLLTFSFYGVFFDYRHTYIGPLWTMRYELIGSYVALLAVVAVRATAWRQVWFAAVAVFLFALAPDDYQMLALFPVGCALADLYQRGASKSVSGTSGALFIVAAFAIRLFAPYNVASWGLAATLFIVGCVCFPIALRLLESRFSGWLGEICFPLYLFHGPVIWIVGEPLIRQAQSIGAKVAIDFVVIVLSIFAAWAFVWTDRAGIACARRLGASFSYLASKTVAAKPR